MSNSSKKLKKHSQRAETKNMDTLETCLHRGSKTHGVRPEGWGNCEICTQDEKNKECKGYYPITLRTFYVQEQDETEIQYRRKY